MSTHSSILAWEIPWTEEPGGLQSMGHKELDMTEQVCARNPAYCFSFEVSLLCSPGKGISSPG